MVLIYTDDQGYADLGVYGSEDLVTPHTDDLAHQGVRFTQMYAPSPLCSASRAGPNEHDLWRNGEQVFYNGRFFPDLVVDEAERFITEHRDQPFFVYVAMNTPHYPYQGEEHWLEHYQEAGVAYPRDLYAAFVSSQDDRIGRLVAVLEDLGLREDTMIIFQSDHGHSVEERAHFGGGSAGPYRGAKFTKRWLLRHQPLHFVPSHALKTAGKALPTVGLSAAARRAYRQKRKYGTRQV